MSDRRGNPEIQSYRVIDDRGIEVYPASAPGRSVEWIEIWEQPGGLSVVEEWIKHLPEKLRHGDVWRACSRQPSMELQKRAREVARKWATS